MAIMDKTIFHIDHAAPVDTWVQTIELGDWDDPPFSAPDGNLWLTVTEGHEACRYPLNKLTARALASALLKWGVMNIGDRVRYVGEITERHCDATLEAFEPDGRYRLRLANGAAFLADPADVREIA